METPGLERFGASLATSRERGRPFDAAWQGALANVAGADYVALKETRDGWRRAYERAPATPREVAVARLVALFETGVTARL